MNAFEDLPATLRRRHRALRREGYEPDWCSVFLAAAEEIVARRKAGTGEELQLALDTIVNNRRLRNAIHQTFTNSVDLHLTPDQQQRLFRPLALAIKATPEPGVGRRILAVDIGTNATREFIEARIREQLDAHFNRPQPGGSNGETQGTQHADLSEDESDEAEEPGGAGRDADQHPVAEARGGEAQEGPATGADRSAGGAAAHDAAHRPAHPGGPEAGADDLPGR
jgi:hypothetical protein